MRFITPLAAFAALVFTMGCAGPAEVTQPEPRASLPAREDAPSSSGGESTRSTLCEGDEDDVAQQVADLGSAVCRKGAIANLHGVYSVVLADNGGERTAQPVMALSDVIVPALTHAYLTHPEDPSSGIDILELLKEARDARALPAFVQALAWRTGLTEQHAVRGAQAIARVRVPDGDLSAVAVALGAAYQRITNVREVDNQMRIEFVRALGGLEGNAATPVLVRIMGNHSENQHFLINRMAARALGENGDPAAVDPLIQALFQFAPGNPSMRMNDVAIEGLVRIGRPSLQPLLSVLDGTHAAANTAADALIAAFRERSPTLNVSREQVVTPEATDALGMLGLADALEPLLAETRARERSRQLNGVVALVRLRLSAAQQRRVRGAVTATYRTLGPDQVELRGQLLATMATTFDAAYFPLMFTTARDQHAHAAVRETALVSLARLANRAQAAQIRSLIAADPDNAARYDEYLLPYLLAAEQCDTDVTCYVGKLTDSDGKVAEKAAQMLGLLAPDDHPAALAGLTQQLGHQVFEVRVAALLALDHLAASGSPAAIDRIQQLSVMEDGRAIWQSFRSLALPIRARLQFRLSGAPDSAP